MRIAVPFCRRKQTGLSYSFQVSWKVRLIAEGVPGTRRRRKSRQLSARIWSFGTHETIPRGVSVSGENRVSFLRYCTVTTSVLVAAVAPAVPITVTV